MAIWKQPFTLEAINQINGNTMVSHLGIVFSHFGDDFLEAQMPVDSRTVQPMGLLHGGASAALAETLGSVAALLCLDDYQTHQVVGVDLNATHLRGVRSGVVTGRATPLRIGRSMQVWNIAISDAAGQLVCTSRLTVAVLERRK